MEGGNARSFSSQELLRSSGVRLPEAYAPARAAFGVLGFSNIREVWSRSVLSSIQLKKICGSTHAHKSVHSGFLEEASFEDLCVICFDFTSNCQDQSECKAPISTHPP